MAFEKENSNLERFENDFDYEDRVPIGNDPVVTLDRLYQELLKFELTTMKNLCNRNIYFLKTRIILEK